VTDEKPSKNPLGPTGERVRDNVRHLREDVRRMSYRELSDQLEALGRRIPTLGLSRIEDGARRVDADDLVALALALGVTPDRLLLPIDADPAEDAALTSAVKARQFQLWGWARGESALLAAQVALGRGDEPVGPVWEDFHRHALPDAYREHESHTAYRAARDVRDRIARLLQLRDEAEREGGDPQTKVKTGAGELRRALARLVAEVDDLIGEDDGQRQQA
jgi:transcriptional regulator with XRE-family HTH domain